MRIGWLSLGALVLGGAVVSAQVDPAGIPQDWSHRHLVFSAPRDANQAWRLEQEPRFRHQRDSRLAATAGANRILALPELAPVAEELKDLNGMPPISISAVRMAQRLRQRADGLWGESLNSSSATVGAGNFPAKFSFSNTAPSAANCAGGATPDFTVFNTSLAGSATQASVIAFDNLYSGTCGGSVPQIYWAYNTSATASIQTAVTLSLDGSQVAFIHTPAAGAAILVLLKWNPNTTGRGFTGGVTNGSPTVTAAAATFTAKDVGAQITGTGIPAGTTIIAVASGTSATMSANATSTQASETITIVAESASTPGVPPTVANAAYSACAAPCMTTIAFGNGDNDNISSPFVDYTNHALYVGDANGFLHKFSGIFSGTPAEVTTSGWPVHVSTQASPILTSPVYDSGSTLVFVADGSGFLYSVTTTGSSTQTVVQSLQMASSGGITEAPLVDSTTAKVYVFVGTDMQTSAAGTCASALGCNGVFQFPANFTSSTALSESVMGVSTAGVPMYAGTFDNTFYSGPGTTGNIWVCGNNGNAPAGRPKLMQIPVSSFVAGSVTVKAVNITNPLTSAAAHCSPVSEISNGAHDWIFLSVTANGNVTGCSGACIYSFDVATPPTGPNAAPSAGRAVAGGASGIIVDNTGAGGGSQIYFSYLSAATAAITCPAPASATTGGCAVQAAQSNLQ